MIPLSVLDAILVTLAALFLLVSAAVLIDRARHDRRVRGLADLHRQLMRANAETVLADRRVQRLSPMQFHQLTHAGLPETTVMGIARSLQARRGTDRLHRDVEGTGTPDVWNRVVSLHLLAAAGGSSQDTYRALDRALRSGEPMLAGAAIRLLMRRNEWRAAQVLVDALVDGACPRARLAAALDRMTVPHWDLLQPLFHHPRPPVRAWAVRLAGRQGMRVLAPEVRALTTDADPIVRRAAMEALGRIGEEADRELVLAGSRDPVPMVRAHAARAAVTFGDEAIAALLVELLADREWIVRAAAREALQRLGPLARPAVTAALWHPDRFASNNAAEILFRTGVITETTRRMLRSRMADGDAMDLLARFGAVGGSHLQTALLAQLPTEEAATIDRIMGASPEPVPVRGR